MNFKFNDCMTIACKEHHCQQSRLPPDSGQVYVARCAEVYACINDGCVYVEMSMCMSFVHTFMSMRVCITVHVYVCACPCVSICCACMSECVCM